MIRLYHKQYASFDNSNKGLTHDSVLMRPGFTQANNIKTLSNPAYHRSGTSIEQLINKANFYTNQQAIDYINDGRRVSNFRIFTEFFLHFFKAFFLRRYCVFGFDGFVDSMILAFSRFIRLAKIRETLNSKPKN